jgi:hypothetical protein
MQVVKPFTLAGITVVHGHESVGGTTNIRIAVLLVSFKPVYPLSFNYRTCSRPYFANPLFFFILRAAIACRTFKQ